MTYVNRCGACGLTFDWLAARYSTPDPSCPQCGAVTARQPCAPAVVWTRPLTAYGDPRKETFRKDERYGGHWTYRKNSGRAAETGVPERVFIQTEAEQRRYCRDEGLIPPSDLPSGSLRVAADGQSFEKGNVSEI